MNLTNLERLILYQNELSGEIPQGMDNLINLENLMLSDNNLTGLIPSELRWD